MIRNFVIFFTMLFVCSFAFAEEVVSPGIGFTMPEYAVWILAGAVVIIDFILGKTTLIKPNSIGDVILQVVKKIISLFLPAK